MSCQFTFFSWVSGAVEKGVVEEERWSIFGLLSLTDILARCGLDLHFLQL